MTSELLILIETRTGFNCKTSDVIAVGDLDYLTNMKASLEAVNLDNEAKSKRIKTYRDHYNSKFDVLRYKWNADEECTRDERLDKIKKYKIDNPIMYPEYFEFQEDGYIDYVWLDIIFIKDDRCLHKITFEIQTVKPSQCRELSAVLQYYQV